MSGFKRGDIIIRLGLKEYSLFNDTQQHVMIVVGVSDDNLPMIAHMSWNDRSNERGSLQYKQLSGFNKNLVLLRFEDWSEEFISQLCESISVAENNNTYYLTKMRLTNQLNQLHCRHTGSEQKKDDMPVGVDEAKIDVTCHEFVVSIIQQTYNKMDLQIPFTLDISPSLAWGNVLVGRAIKHKGADNVIKIDNLRSLALRPPIKRTQKQASASNSFFSEWVHFGCNKPWVQRFLPAPLDASRLIFKKISR